MQDNGHNRNGPTNPEIGETIELCNVQRKDEPHPCENIEPCDKHCGAKLRGERAGRKCSNNAMVNGRCRMHGGHAARGIGAPHFKDGRRSRYRPKGLKDDYEEALKDPAYTENRDELALTRAAIQQVLNEMGEDSQRLS